MKCNTQIEDNRDKKETKGLMHSVCIKQHGRVMAETKEHNKEKLITAGGQAVIEGVMMRSQNSIAIAVRRPDRKICVKKQRLRPVSGRRYLGFLKWPFLRGTANLIEMLVVGIKALNYSANVALEEDEEETSIFQMVLSLALALFFAVLLFKFLPLLIAQFFYDKIDFVRGHYLIFNFIDGSIKIILFVLYILAISLMKDIRILFAYHGAEHAAVNCYEAKKKLTFENIRQFTTLHPRCGTSFLIIVLFVSIFIYTFIPQGYSFALKFALRLLLLPVIAGISYEILRLAGRYRENLFLRIAVFPGMVIQRLTTRKPNRKQIEAAVAALKAVLDK